MGWAKATIAISAALVGTGVKIGIRNTRGGSRMALTITGATMKDLAWADGDKVEVMIGEAEHHGLMRVRKNNSAGQAVVSLKAAVRGGSYLLIPLGHQPAFVDRSEAARWCKWENVEDGWIEIVMPKWADETAPRKPAAAAPPPSAHRTPAPEQSSFVQKRNVTSAVMGDPPPGRREMLAKMADMKV